MLVEFRDREFVKSTIVITHDLSILYQIADTILVMYAGKLVEKASAAEITERSAAPVHAAPARVAARGRGALRREAAERDPGPAAVAPQPADRLSVPRPLSARVREVRRGAAVRRGRAGPVRSLLEGGRLMLKLDGVTKVFKVGMFGEREVTAVSAVSFVVDPGEVVSLIGESGSGKTTVGRMILRLTSATAGAITFDGRDVLGARPARAPRLLRARAGGVPGPVQLVQPRLQGRPRLRHDPLELPPRPEREPSGRRSCDESLEAVSLEPADVLGKYPHQLSGGQLQRLMIARALLLDIKFLVADEIISMLDASTRIDVLNLLGDLKERGLGVLFITHDLSLGNYISDKTLILRRGEVVEMGATEKVYGKPAHPYTQMLLGSVPHLTERWDAQARRHPRPRTTTATCRSSSWKPTISPQSEETHERSRPHRAALTLSFMGANYVGRELGYGAADEWGPFDVATNAAFEPIETFGARFEELLTAVVGSRVRSPGSLARAPELALGDARARRDRSRPPRPPRAPCRQPRRELRLHCGRARSRPAGSRTRSTSTCSAAWATCSGTTAPGPSRCCVTHGVRFGYENHRRRARRRSSS